MREPYPSETQDRFAVRLPDGMRDRLKAIAKANKRTLNAEIVARLEASFREEDERSASAKDRVLAMRLTDAPDPILKRLTEMERRVADLEKGAR